MYVERGRLAAAQACLTHAHNLAPSEDYILRHLQIVQTRIARLRTSVGMDKEKEVAFAEFDPKEYGGDLNLRGAATKQHLAVNSEKRASLDKDRASAGKKPPTAPQTATTTTSVSKKISANGVVAAAQNLPSSQIEEPIFIESEAMSSKIHNDYHYRPSNSGHSTMSRNINSNFHYNRKVIKTLSGHQAAGGAQKPKPTTQQRRRRQLGSDFDDPSSGMS